MPSLLNRDTLTVQERARAEAAESAAVAATTAETTRAEIAETGLSNAINTSLAQAEQYANTALFPLSWGDVAGLGTWDAVNNDNASWAIAGNHTWGTLFAVKSWQYVLDSGKSWLDALSYTWETL